MAKLSNCTPPELILYFFGISINALFSTGDNFSSKNTPKTQKGTATEQFTSWSRENSMSALDMEELSLTFIPSICNSTQWIWQSECRIWDDI